MDILREKITIKTISGISMLNPIDNEVTSAT